MQTYFEDLACGSALPSRQYGPLTIADTVRWAGLQENWSQLHYDRDYVREHNGMRTFIASGAYREALLFRMLTEWVGPKGQLNKVSLRHTYSTFEGDSIYYSGTISEVSPSLASPWVRCEIEGKNQEGRQILTGSCVLIVPARNPPRSGGKS